MINLLFGTIWFIVKVVLALMAWAAFCSLWD